MKKVLVLNWNSVNDNNAVIASFRELNLDCAIVDLNGQYFRDSRHASFFDDLFRKNKYDLVYSTNYFDYLADNCHKHGIPYMAWAYDSPAVLDDIDKLRYDTTHIFLFDSYEVMKYSERDKLKNIHHLPLAADTDRFESVINGRYDRDKYRSDISFVGSLYGSNIDKYLNQLSDYHKGMFNGIVDYCTGRYDEFVLETLNASGFFYWGDETKFNESVSNDESNGQRKLVIKSDEEPEISSRVARMAANSITNRERLILISMLSNHWEFKLYSTSTHEVFKTTIECGGVDYYTGMPRVFNNSKINLNITNKGIKSGIPLRCMDIMGSRGLLMTNYQRDFEEDFKDGENIVIYRSLDEAYEKCKYYLEHEDVRRRVADRGYETVKTKYNYRTLIRRAIDMADLGYLLK